MSDHYTVTRTFLERLKQAVAPAQVLSKPAEMEAYAWDNTQLRYMPGAVVLAENRDQVVAALKTCNDAGMAVTPRCAGTGNVGGALAVQGGVVLSTQKMNRILEIVPEDRLARVEPGVINDSLQGALAPHGLFWPPNPSSAKSCAIGGNLAMCAAGPNAIRYGVTRDWVLGLEAVLADGTVIETGGWTTKNVVGYDLTRLLIGSEGTLAVITQAIVKLAPRPQARRMLRAFFSSVSQAAKAVSQLMAVGEPPSAIEFLDAACLDILRSENTVDVPDTAQALLLLEVSGNATMIDGMAEAVNQQIQALKPVEMAVAESDAEAEQIWSARHALSPALKKLSPKRINEDVVVPVSRLAALIDGVSALAKQSAIPIVCFGHAGNGNIHVNMLVDPADAAIMARAEKALEKLFDLVIRLNGSLSGEHGIGVQKKAFMSWEVGTDTLALQRRIKRLFDPLGIMNPGKIFPDT
ncbi:MAG: FAD-binding protein [Magnetococcales bacterium]|nr:FAD-binding protein [Magnetococcales bacterium]